MWLAERWLQPVAWAGLLGATAWGMSSAAITGPAIVASGSILVAVADLSLWVRDELRERGLQVPEGHRLPVPAWGPFAVVTGFLGLGAGSAIEGRIGLVLAAAGALALLAGSIDTAFAFLGSRQPLAAQQPRSRPRRSGLLDEPEVLPRHRVRRARAIRRAAGAQADRDGVPPRGQLLDIGRGRTRIVVDAPVGYADMVVDSGPDGAEAELVAALADLQTR